MVDTYRGSPAYDPAGWLVLLDGDGQAIGCLLSTPHPDSGSLEITYMGLVPESRRLGYAASVVERAWELALQRGLSQLTLAVDRANCPAIKLYRRHGFEPLISESVWGRSLGWRPEIPAGLQSSRSGV